MKVSTSQFEFLNMGERYSIRKCESERLLVARKPHEELLSSSWTAIARVLTANVDFECCDNTTVCLLDIRRHVTAE